MPNCSENLRNGRVTRCAVCEGRFGLVRYYSWRTPLCSKKCVDRFRARRQADGDWVGRLFAGKLIGSLRGPRRTCAIARPAMGAKHPLSDDLITPAPLERPGRQADAAA